MKEDCIAADVLSKTHHSASEHSKYLFQRLEQAAGAQETTSKDRQN